jgi:4-amino-4-deoxy-L-arabinose transferase-like glycosyltransferase
MKNSWKHILVLVGFSYVIFMLGNGLLPLSDPDEVFYAQTAKEMVIHHEWNVPFIFGQPQFEKPILIYWLLRLAFLWFGITEFAARFFPALFAACGVIAVYFFALIGFKDRRKSLVSALALMSMGLYLAMARTVFTDMVFSVLIFLALFSFFWGYTYSHRRNQGVILFFLFAALATLAKGPLGLFLPAATVGAFLIFEKKPVVIPWQVALAGLLVFAAVCLPWYVFITAKYGDSFTREFFYNDHIRRIFFAEHANSDKWYFYPGVIIGLSFPWCIFLGAAFIRLWRTRLNLSSTQRFLVCWVAAVFVIFQVAHSKLASYILPLFPALALFCGDYICEMLSERRRSDLIKTLFIATEVLLLLVPIGAVFAVFKFKFQSLSFISVSVFIAVLVAWLSSMLAFILKKKSMLVLYMIVLSLPVFFIFNPIDKEEIESYFSTEDIGSYLQKNCPDAGTILASKFFARGALYYTGKQVAIFALGEKNFFSPHPAEFLDSEDKVSRFLLRNKVTYCVINRKQAGKLESISGRNGFVCRLLFVSGNCRLYKVKPL